MDAPGKRAILEQIATCALPNFSAGERYSTHCFELLVPAADALDAPRPEFAAVIPATPGGLPVRSIDEPVSCTPGDYEAALREILELPASVWLGTFRSLDTSLFERMQIVACWALGREYTDLRARL